MSDQSPTANPLLYSEGLPPFESIKPEHVVPAMEALLAELGDELDRIERSATSTWESTVQPLEALGERLGRAWGVVGHLMGVQNSDELRAAHEEMQPKVVEFSLRMGQSRPIYEGLLALRESPEFGALDPTKKRIVESMLRDARHSGVGLEGEERDVFNVIQRDQAEAATQFSNNVLDETKAFGLTLRTPEEIEGLPPSLLRQAAQAARQAGDDDATPERGPWRITLDFPSLGPFLQHSRRRDLREQVYRANVTRASRGDKDNGPLIRKILELRHDEAVLLGFPDFAALSLDSKMAPDVGAVEKMLEELRTASYDAAKADLGELADLARSEGAAEADDLQPWDVAFWAERLREKRYAYTDEELRPYFPLPKVLDGLFALAERLFDVTIRAADGEAPVWHEDVRFFRVFEGDTPIAAFYLDPFSRPAEKRGGAWMDECIGRAPGRTPVAYLVCNQAPPVGDKPSQMTFGEVETLFHEFGHGLQHMLTRIEEPMASGIRNVEWDAVELPSQFMENWCYHRETLLGLTEHVDTRERLPDELFEKIVAARTFRAGSNTLRQLYFAFVDIALHHGYDPEGEESPFDVQRRIAETATVLPPIPEDRFLCAFGHIFAGGYAAGYYSYKWAEVLSADAFAAFEEVGLDDEDAVRSTGKRYRDTVLALGGSRPPMEVFQAFRGRAPTTDALLRHSGLAS